MKTYKIKFSGREKDCIGAFYFFTEIVEAENEKDARMKLYEKYEHVHCLTFETPEEK